jgi:hypothetical protein
VVSEWVECSKSIANSAKILRFDEFWWSSNYPKRILNILESLLVKGTICLSISSYLVLIRAECTHSESNANMHLLSIDKLSKQSKTWLCSISHGEGFYTSCVFGFTIDTGFVATTLVLRNHHRFLLINH